MGRSHPELDRSSVDSLSCWRRSKFWLINHHSQLVANNNNNNCPAPEKKVKKKNPKNRCVKSRSIGLAGWKRRGFARPRPVLCSHGGRGWKRATEEKLTKQEGDRYPMGERGWVAEGGGHMKFLYKQPFSIMMTYISGSCSVGGWEGGMDHHKKKKRRRRRRRRGRREKTAASLCSVSLLHCCCLFDWNINGGVFSTGSREDKQTDRKQSAVSGSGVDICSWRLYSYYFFIFYKRIH